MLQASRHRGARESEGASAATLQTGREEVGGNAQVHSRSSHSIALRSQVRGSCIFTAENEPSQGRRGANLNATTPMCMYAFPRTRFTRRPGAANVITYTSGSYSNLLRGCTQRNTSMSFTLQHNSLRIVVSVLAFATRDLYHHHRRIR